MGILIACVVVGLIPAFVANAKGKNFFLWWLFGAALWIVAMPWALLLKPSQATLDNRSRSAGLKACPHCREFIRPDAKVCRFCGRDL